MAFTITCYGNVNNGKSALIDSLNNIPQQFSYTRTKAAVDFLLLHINDKLIKIWDCSGDLRHQTLITSLFVGSSLGILTVDLSQSLDETAISQQLLSIKQHTLNMPIVLVGTKADLERQINDAQFFNLKKKYRFHAAIVTSTVTNIGLNQLRAIIYQEIIEQEQQEQLKKSPFANIKLTLPANHLLFIALTQLENALNESRVSLPFIVEYVNDYISALKNSNTIQDAITLSQRFIEQCNTILTLDKKWGISANLAKKIEHSLYAVGLALGVTVLIAASGFLLGASVGLLLTSSLSLPPLVLGHCLAGALTLVSLPFALHYIYDSFSPTPIETAIWRVASSSTRYYHKSHTFFASSFTSIPSETPTPVTPNDSVLGYHHNINSTIACCH